jgi:hypothetical protein
MTYAEAIEILKGQKLLLENTAGIDGWFDTAEHYIQDIFGTSNQLSNFRQLKSDYRLAKIFKHDQNAIKGNDRKFQTMASHQIAGLILYLREKEQLELKGLERQQVKKQQEIFEMEKKQKEQERQKKEREVENRNAVQVEPPSKEKQEKLNSDNSSVKKINMEEGGNKHYVISKVLFWTIIPIIGGVIGFAYFLGNENGKAKFDQEKINMYDENKTLTKDLSNTRDTISFLNNSINSWKKLANEYYQCLSKQQKDSLGKTNY